MGAREKVSYVELVGGKGMRAKKENPDDRVMNHSATVGR